MKHFWVVLLVVILVVTMCKAYSSETSSYDQLIQSWNPYKTYFVQDDGRVIDYYAESVTTSEGQSYALLRSVWMNDQQTFDKVLNWTNNNLKIRGDNLYGWKWGKNPNGEWKIIDKSVASDADQDIAFALIIAYEKWNDPKYLTQAKLILSDIWDKLVININGANYLVAGDWATQHTEVKLNPSYFAPYAYRFFSKYDTSHNWNSLIDSSYDVIEQSSKHSVVNLPPDWAYINKNTSEITVKEDNESNFSYDAIRVMWRVSLDYLMNCDKRALEYLKKSTKFLIKHWKTLGTLPASVNKDGVVIKQADSYAVYGAVLPAIGFVEPETANSIYYKKLAAEYVKGYWSNPRDYYAQNIIWFGIATWYNIGNNKSEELCKKGFTKLIDR